MGLQSLSGADFGNEARLGLSSSVRLVFNFPNVLLVEESRVYRGQFGLKYLVYVGFVLLYAHLRKPPKALKIVHQVDLLLVLASCVLS